jgi:hypothetical protein
MTGGPKATRVRHLGHISVSSVVVAPQALQKVLPASGLAPQFGQNSLVSTVVLPQFRQNIESSLINVVSD